jgi:heme-degrading monooxygenase HmoA
LCHPFGFIQEYLVVTLINCFEVPDGREEEFFAGFQKVNAYMRAKNGYVSHKMHRSMAPDARYRFVNVVQWESREACEAAHDAGFRELITQPALSSIRSTPALYEVVHEGRAEIRE